MRHGTLFLLMLVFLLNTTGLKAQDEGYKFEDIKRLPTTSVKDQNRSGTCWSFSALSFLESELMRMGKDKMDLSEMFVVKHCYADKAKKHVRLHGNLNFAGGGAFHDVTYVLKEYGMVPEKVFPGLDYGEDNHVHGEMDHALKEYINAIIDKRNSRLSTAWFEGYKGILDAYLGEDPGTFTYEGKEYSPRTFADEYLELDPDNYIELTSYSHQPFYSKFPLLVPDNWLWDEVYNVPLDELVDIMYHSVNEGHTIAWAADVSEKGFSHKNGVAIVPTRDIESMKGSERARWENLTEEERKERMYSFNGPVPEKTITQEMRQEGYDRYETTDDHGMHIVGTAKDQTGKNYFIVKNSWAESNKYDGYLYVSEAFVRYKTMDIMIHKDALPDDIRNKLGL